jgi:hypothetical protein
MSADDIDRLAKAMPLITDNGVNEALTLGIFWDSPQMTDQAKDGYRAQVRAILREALYTYDADAAWKPAIDALLAD